MTDSDKKQMGKDLKILEKSVSSSQYRYESENFEDNIDNMDPSAANAKMAAEMGIEYPQDFDFEEPQNPEKSREIIFKSKPPPNPIGSKSPDPFAENAQDAVKFNKKPLKLPIEPPSIQDIDPSRATQAQPSTTPEEIPSKPEILEE